MQQGFRTPFGSPPTPVFRLAAATRQTPAAGHRWSTAPSPAASSVRNGYGRGLPPLTPTAGFVTATPRTRSGDSTTAVASGQLPREAAVHGGTHRSGTAAAGVAVHDRKEARTSFGSSTGRYLRHFLTLRTIVLCILCGNLVFLGVLALLYYNARLFAFHAWPMLWALLCSLALWRTRIAVEQFITTHCLSLTPWTAVKLAAQCALWVVHTPKRCIRATVTSTKAVLVAALCTSSATTCDPAQDACAAPKTEQRTGPRTRRRLRPVGSAHTTPAPRAKLAPVTPLTPLSALMSRLRGKSTRRPRLPRAHLGTQARLPAAQLGAGQVPETAPSGAPEEAAAQKLEEDDEYSVAQSMWQALGMAYITYAVITFPQVLLWALAVAVVDVCVCTVLEWCVLVASGPTVLRARFAVADALRDHCPGLWRAVCGRGAMPRTPPGGKSNRLREAKPPQAGFLQRQFAGWTRSLVAVLLILGLVLGSIVLTMFFAVNCYDETASAFRQARVSVRDVMQDADWLQRAHLSNGTLAGTVETLTKYADASVEWVEARWPHETELVKQAWKWYKESDNATTDAEDELRTCAVDDSVWTIVWAPSRWKELLPLLSTSLNTTSNTEEGSAGGTIEPALAQSASQMLMNDYGAKVVEGATAVFWAVGNTTITAWSSVLQFTVSLFLFLNLLYYLLTLEQDMVTVALDFVPMKEARILNEALEETVRQVFVLNGKVMAFHCLYTWILFRFFGVTHLVYTASVLSSLCTVVPLLPAWLVAVPGAAEMALSGSPTIGVALWLAHYGGLWCADVFLYGEMPVCHPSVLGLSIIAGLAAFGPQGAVLGPLLVTVAVATYTFLRKALHDSQAAAETLLGQLSPQPQPRTSARRRVVWGAPIRGIETPKGGVATTPAHTAQVATAEAAGLGARKPARAPASAPPARRRAVAAGRARCIGDSPAGADAGSGLLAAVQAQCRNGGSRSAHSSIPEGAEECAEGGISPMERTAPASPARARAQATTVGEESSCGVGGDGQGATEAVASPQRRLCAANATALQRSPRRRAVLDA